MRDVIIVGGGPAGLSAALILGRCRRRVLLIDSGHPRNAVTPRMHGFLGRDGRPPGDLRDEGRRELAAYDTVEIWDGRAVDAVRRPDGFRVVMEDQRRADARRLILATGLRTDLPAIEGFSEFWGHGVHHCPYCDGYENGDRPLAVYGPGEAAKGLALELTAWSRDLTLFTDGPCGLDDPERDRLARNGIRIEERPVARLEGEDGRFARVRLRDGTALECAALFFTTGPASPPRSSSGSAAMCRARARCRPATTRRRTYRDSTSRVTRRGGSSSRSWPPPRGRWRPSPSTPSSCARTHADSAADSPAAPGPA